MHDSPSCHGLGHQGGGDTLWGPTPPAHENLWPELLTDSLLSLSEGWDNCSGDAPTGRQWHLGWRQVSRGGCPGRGQREMRRSWGCSTWGRTDSKGTATTFGSGPSSMDLEGEPRGHLPAPSEGRWLPGRAAAASAGSELPVLPSAASPRVGARPSPSPHPPTTLANLMWLSVSCFRICTYTSSLRGSAFTAPSKIWSVSSLTERILLDG